MSTGAYDSSAVYEVSSLLFTELTEQIQISYNFFRVCKQLRGEASVLG